MRPEGDDRADPAGLSHAGNEPRGTSPPDTGRPSTRQRVTGQRHEPREPARRTGDRGQPVRPGKVIAAVARTGRRCRGG
ncbi:MAG TPA: hypothetical protein VEL03_01640 [Streptosporangiaceae bacterium]|nr:hypothetical protein [Streptosporangiaceae bacterium]